MSICPPPFPWDPISLPEPNTDFTSPGDLIVKIINFHFQIKGTRIIFETLPHENAYLPEAIPIKDSSFARIIKSIGQISQHCLDSSVCALNTWRLTMNPFSEFTEPPPVEKSRQSQMNSKAVKTRTIEESNQGERQGLIVDYIFTEVMKRVIAHYNGTNVKAQTMDSLEEGIFKFFIAVPRCKTEVATRNREFIRNSFRLIIKQIGRYRIGGILAKFFTNYTINLKTPAPTIALMDGLIEVIANHTNIDEVKAACGILQTVDSNLKPWVLKVKKIEQKMGFCTFLGGILSPMSRVASQNINSESKTNAANLVESIEAALKKSKNKQKHLYLLPLAASALCVCEHATFYSKFDFILENLLVPQKDSVLRTACLEALYNLIYASMHKFEDKNEVRRQKIRGFVATNLCPTNKKSSVPVELEQIDIVIDIIELLSLIDVESVIGSLVMPFLQITQPLIPEMIIIGIYSLLRIFKRLGGYVLTNLYPQILSHLIDHPKTRHRKQTLREILESKPMNGRPIGESHLSAVSQCLSQAITSLHQSVGNYTKVGDVKNLDTLPKERLFQIYALEASLAGIQIVIPNSIHSSELFTYITKYSLHIYPGIEMNAIQTLKQVIVQRPSFRFLISHSLFKLIYSIPDHFQEPMNSYANNLLEILRAWYHQQADNIEHKEQKNNYDGKASISESNFAQLDALGFFFLTQPNHQTQLTGFEIIKTTKVLSEFYPNPYPNLYTTIVNHGAEAIASGVISKYIFSEPDLILTKTPNIEEFFKLSDSNDLYRIRHSKVLAKLLNFVILNNLLETAKSFIKIVKDRIIPLQHSLDQGKQEENIIHHPTISYNEKFLLWRNYVSALCASCSVIDTNSNEISQVADQFAVESARDLFRAIIPIMLSEKIDRRNAVEGAISYLLPPVRHTLLSELANYEKTAFVDERAKPKVKLSYAIMLSYIYRIIVENLSKGMLFDDDSTLQHIFTVLRHQIDRIPEGASPTENTLDIQFWRYNVCLTLKFVFMEINNTKQLQCKDQYDQEFFDHCFSFLSKCSGFGDTQSSTPDQQKMKDWKALLQFIADKPFDERENCKAIFEKQSDALQLVASEALVQLCYGPCDEEEQRRKIIWIGNVFASGSKKHKEFARKAMINVLRSNKERKAQLFAFVIDECYSGDPNKAINYFFVISELYQNGKLPLYPAVLLTLGLHKICSDNYDTRQVAIKFLKQVCKLRFPGKYTFVESATIYDTYQSNQALLASQIAQTHPSISLDFINETLIRFRLLDDTARERLLKIIHPFLSNINLSKLSKEQSCALLETLSIITYKYGEQFTSTIEKIWSNLATSAENVVAILNYLISFSCLKRNNNILNVGEKISLLLSRVQPKKVINKLVYELFSSDRIGRMLSPDEYREKCEVDMEEQSKIKPSWAKDAVFIFPSILKLKPFSRSNIAVIFLQGIIIEKFEYIKEYIPLIFLTMILSMDVGNDRLTLGYKSIINNLYFHISSLQDVNLENVYRSIIEYLEKGWNKSDFMNATFERENKLSQFVHFLIEFTKPLIENMKYQLMMCSLKCAYSSESSHLVCRSLQIFRYLGHGVTNDILFYLLSILKQHLTSRSPNSSRNTMYEVLLALQSTAEISTYAEILNHPQIWTTALISLQTDNEKEYSLAIDLLAILLSNLNFNDPLVVEKLANPLALQDSHIASGIQPIILKGLTSEKTEEVSRTLLSEFLTIQFDKLIDPSPTRHVDNIVSLLPYILANIVSDDKEEIENVIRVSSSMADLFRKLGYPDIATSLMKFAQGEFEDANEFLLEFNKPFYQHFVLGHEVRVFSSLFYNILYGSKKYKTCSFLVFEAFLSLVDITNSPLQRQMMGMFYHLLELMETDKWSDLVAVFDVSVENSLPIEKYEFSVLPNPSSMAKHFEKVESVRSPWTSCDNNKPAMLTALSNVLKTLSQPKFMELKSFGDKVTNLAPLIDEGEGAFSHNEPTSSNVIRLNKLLKFSEDVKKKKNDEENTEVVIRPEYDTPLRPIVIPQPHLAVQKFASIRKSRFIKRSVIDK